MSLFGFLKELSEFSHPDGRKMKVGAWKPSPKAPDRKVYKATRFASDELPPFVDLRAHLTPVEDQGEVGSCTANALAGAYEYLEKRTTGQQGRVSRLFIYYNERDAEGSVHKDNGACLSTGIDVLKQHGACSEDTWPYQPKKFLYEKPHQDAYQEASAHTIDDAHSIDVNLHAMRHCLAEGYPFVFGLHLFKSFEDEGNHGRISIPNYGKEKSEGGHAMLCVGYSDKDRVFLVRNSWGPKWGDQGYCYIPYDYMGNEKWTDDCWTIRRAHNLDFSHKGGPTVDPTRPAGKLSFFDEIVSVLDVFGGGGSTGGGTTVDSDDTGSDDQLNAGGDDEADESADAADADADSDSDDADADSDDSDDDADDADASDDDSDDDADDSDASDDDSDDDADDSDASDDDSDDDADDADDSGDDSDDDADDSDASDDASDSDTSDGDVTDAPVKKRRR